MSCECSSPARVLVKGQETVPSDFLFLLIRIFYFEILLQNGTSASAASSPDRHHRGSASRPASTNEQQLLVPAAEDPRGAAGVKRL